MDVIRINVFSFPKAEEGGITYGRKVRESQERGGEVAVGMRLWEEGAT